MPLAITGAEKGLTAVSADANIGDWRRGCTRAGSDRRPVMSELGCCPYAQPTPVRYQLGAGRFRGDLRRVVKGLGNSAGARGALRPPSCCPIDEESRLNLRAKAQRPSVLCAKEAVTRPGRVPSRLDVALQRARGHRRPRAYRFPEDPEGSALDWKIDGVRRRLSRRTAPAPTRATLVSTVRMA
jgi:hypothetical protein